MLKSLEALVRGYILFRVNDQYFLTYTRARNHRLTITHGLLKFEGLHLWKGWQGFFYRIMNKDMRVC